MDKQVCKLRQYSGSFRLVIPKKMMQMHRWIGALYVTVEYMADDSIIIKRLINEEVLKERDKKGPPKGYRPPRSR